MVTAWSLCWTAQPIFFFRKHVANQVKPGTASRTASRAMQYPKLHSEWILDTASSEQNEWRSSCRAACMAPS
ncbi:hypothetical protein EUGRSUZ_I01269 [Eucalyptus grandis]|uniref:Uncharacterized protein n=2 Tax=Eucalyptus grandis TaxID=71139 RepID=A0ACC3JFC7_EUCGR|nr:hypothetical protein EUGRSUZ_I01269 [Eucalyptus grandis]